MERGNMGWVIFFGILTITSIILSFLSFTQKLSHSKLLRGEYDTVFPNNEDRKHPNYRRACVYMGIVYLVCGVASLLLALYYLTGDKRLEIALTVIVASIFLLLILSVILFRKRKE